jgi:hypothetical protein
MPVKTCKSDGKPGYKWGNSGKCYTYPPGDAKARNEAKRRAVVQGIAIGDKPATKGVELSAELEMGAEVAESLYLESLIVIYERALEDAAESASQMFALTAAADWQPPAEGSILTALRLAALAEAANAKAIPVWRKIMLEVAAGPLGRIGIAWDVKHPLVVGQIEKAAQRTGAQISEASQFILRATIADAYEHGLTVGDTAQQIRSAMNEAAPYQAEMLARTDLNSLANGASKSAASLTGMQFKTWVATFDDKTRPEHADAHGQTVPINDPFVVGGEDADYPGDPALSDAMAANCRCTLAYGESLAEAEALLADGGQTMSHLSQRQRAKRNQRRAARKTAAASAAVVTTSLDSSGGTSANNGGTSVNSEGRFHEAWDRDFGQDSDAIIAATLGAPSTTAWISDLAFENTETDDGRFILPNALSWRDVPLTLMAMTETGPGGHQGAFVAGKIEKIRKDKQENMDGEPLEGDVVAIRGSGIFDMAGEKGADVARLVNDEIVRGISIDMAIQEIAFRDPETGEVIPKDEAGIDEVIFGDLQLAIKKGTILAATVCPTPAFANARIALTAAAGDEPVVRLWAPFKVERALTAAAAPERPPRAWFETSEPPGQMPLTISEEGRVFGHIATWDSCHVGFLPSCVPPPKSDSSYAYFHVCELDTEDGDAVTVGKLMFSPSDGGHADRTLSASKASAYYDRTGMAAAYLRVIDGEHGIWAAGSLNPALSDEQRAAMRRELRLHPPSGDWRPINGQYELICALAVAVPGFPTPRASISITASGDEIVLEDAIIASSGQIDPDPEAVKALAASGLVDDEMAAEVEMGQLVQRANWRDKLAEILKG